MISEDILHKPWRSYQLLDNGKIKYIKDKTLEEKIVESPIEKLRKRMARESEKRDNLSEGSMVINL